MLREFIYKDNVIEWFINYKNIFIERKNIVIEKKINILKYRKWKEICI